MLPTLLQGVFLSCDDNVGADQAIHSSLALTLLECVEQNPTMLTLVSQQRFSRNTSTDAEVLVSFVIHRHRHVI